MKGASLFIAIFALALLMLPMVAVGFDTSAPQNDAVQLHVPGPEQGPQESGPPAEESRAQPAAEALAPETAPEEPQEPPKETSAKSGYNVSEFKILDQSTGEVLTVSVRDYVRGAVAAEMPASFHIEAMKAQAVAAHTFALHNHIVQQKNPTPELKGADFAADPSNMLVYITEEKAREFYGPMADEYWNKICEAADSVLPYVLEYEDEPIVAAYHAISAGQTEDAANVWVGSAPYLQAAESEGDLLAPDYETSVTLYKEEVEAILLQAHPKAELPEDPHLWFQNIKRSESSYVTGVDVGGVRLHGKDLRALFGLRSHNIDIEYSQEAGSFTFYVYGYGHGVGLSQYGADFMARQGSTFDEILRNYYTGVTLKQIAAMDENS